MTSLSGGVEKIRAVIVIVSLLANGCAREWRYDRVITTYYTYAIELLQKRKMVCKDLYLRDICKKQSGVMCIKMATNTDGTKRIEI